MRLNASDQRPRDEFCSDLLLARQCACLGVLGLLLAVIGGFGVFYVYAFASMVDPSLLPAEQRLAIVKSMFLTGSVVPTVIGLITAVTGIMLCAWSAAAAFGLIGRTVGRGTMQWTTAILAASFVLAILVAAMS